MDSILNTTNSGENLLEGAADVPSFLKPALRMMNSSPLPMGVAVGKSFQLLFNSSFEQLFSNSGKAIHPGITCPELFLHTWGELAWAFESTLTGLTHKLSNINVVAPPNGNPPNGFFDFVLSPLADDEDGIYGVWITLMETTTRITEETIPASGQKSRNLANQAPEEVAKQTILEAEQRLRLAIDAADLGTFDWDLVTNHFLASSRVKTIFGFDEGAPVDQFALIGRFHPDDKKIRDNAIRKSFETGSLHYEARVFPPGQGVRWVKVYGKISFNDFRKPLRMYGTVTDITEEKNTLLALEESENRFNIAINAARLATYDVNLKNDNLICSPRFFEIFDVDPKSPTVRQDSLNTLHPEDRPVRDKAHAQGVPDGGFEYEARIIWKDKSIHWIKVNAIYQYEHNIPVRILGTVMDITEQKFYINSLQESEQRFKLIADTTPVMLWMSSTEMLCIFVNKAWLEFTGKKFEEAEGNGWSSGVHPEDLERLLDAYTTAFKNREPFHAEYRLKRNDDIYRWISDNGRPRYAADGEFLGFIGGSIDIDDQKRLNEKLTKSEARLRIAALSGELGTWDYDPAAGSLFWDDACAEIFGVPGMPPSLKLLGEFIHPEDYALASKKSKLSLDPDIAAPFEIEFRVHHRVAQKEKWLLAKGRAFFENRTMYRFAGTVLDITDKKLALQALQDSELLFKTISNTSPVGLWLTNEHGGNTFVNETWVKWTGLPLEAQLRDGWNRSLPEEDRARISVLFTTAFQLRQKFVGEFRFANKKNELRWALTEGFPYYNSEGNFAGYVGSVTDITQLHAAMDDVKKNEERFKLLADAVPQFVWTTDALGNFTYFNESTYKYTGFKNEEELVKNWKEIVHQQDWDENMRRWLHSLETGEDFVSEHRMKRFDGVYRWQLCRALPQRDINGNIQMWIGSSTDIHDQKLAADELEKKVRQRTAEIQKMNDEAIQQKEFVEIILDSSLILVTVFDADKRIIAFNKKCEEVFGLKKENILGKKFREVFPKIELSETYKSLERALKGENLHIKSHQSFVNDHFYESFFVPLKDKNNNVYAVLMTAHDITDIVSSAEKVQLAYSILEEQNRALERSNQELESFSYVASHDLQEPLRKIQTFIELLHRNLHDPDAFEKYFKKITHAAQRMAALINDVLNYSRLGRQENPFTSVDLNKILQEIKTDFELLISEKAAVIQYDQLPVIYGNASQINQLFANLMSNALKFSGSDLLIKIQSSLLTRSQIKKIEGLNPSLHYSHIVFSDNGIGFEQKFAEKIFAIFQRLNNRMYDGTGIGLALCKKIVENHQGVIYAVGTPGKGATFHLYLPLFGL